jgi:glycosyltransferase involved in cell wall biosynthesis
MRVSLILATKGRVGEVDRFIRSLPKQEHPHLELIVVDQNEDNRLEALLIQANVAFAILHLRSKPGLSHARNVGLASVTGDIVAFPDDDCWYPDGLLARIVWEFQSHPLVDGFTGRSEDGKGHASGGSFSRCQSKVNLNNVWKKGISYTIFLRSSVFAAVGLFDENLGLGARTPFLSGEETDYLIRAVKQGFNIQYLPDLVVFHRNPVLYDQTHCNKAFHYGAGMGRVLSKHHYNLSYNLYAVLRPVAGAILSLVTLRTRKAAYHLAIAKGRIFGLWPRHTLKLCSPLCYGIYEKP